MLGIVPVILMAATLNPTGGRHVSAWSPPVDPRGTITYRALDDPRTGDAFLVRLAAQQKAQARSNAVFAALAALLGGMAPALNYVPTGSPLLTAPADMSANTQALPGAPAGSINVDPLATVSIADDRTTSHSVAVNQLPHEMAHLRQTAQVLTDVLGREGGAQAFADLVAKVAAQRAGIPYAESSTPDGYDGSYADYVRQVNAQRGRDWILAGQFGRPGSPVWP